MESLFLLGAALYAIVGGPGAGKSSIIKELDKRGIKAYDEAATTLISERLNKGICQPWLKENFQKDVFDLQLSMEKEAENLPVSFAFVDRGLLDSLVYLRHRNRVGTAEYKYIQGQIKNPKKYKAVFFIEPYGGKSFVTTKTEIRPEGTKEALQLSKAIKDEYSKYYELISIPGGLSPAKRAKIILSKLENL